MTENHGSAEAWSAGSERRRTLTARAATIAALVVGLSAVFLFQSAVYGHLVTSRFSSLAPPIYYGFWLVCLTALVLQIATRPGSMLAVMPFLVLMGCIVLLVLLHPPLGVVGRTQIVSCVLFGALVLTLSSSKASVLVMQASAWMTAVTACLTLFEMHVPGMLSEVAGRSAGLFGNPNVAGAAIVVGGAASAPFVPSKWRGAFLVLALSGIVATLSRTSLLVFFGAGIVAIVVWRIRKRPVALERDGLVRAGITFLVCVLVIVSAIALNREVALSSAAATNTAATAFDAARAASTEMLEPENALEVANLLGQVDSGGARLILMHNAFNQITLWGHGAEVAHSLLPHNQYLFFAVAFGLPGILVGLALVLTAFVLLRANPFFALAMAGVFVFSHDFTMLELAVPMGIGCAGAVWLGANRDGSLTPSSSGHGRAKHQDS